MLQLLDSLQVTKVTKLSEEKAVKQASEIIGEVEILDPSEIISNFLTSVTEVQSKCSSSRSLMSSISRSASWVWW